jgi:hypothetical protein
VDDELRRTLENTFGAEDLSSLNDCDSTNPVADISTLIFANARSVLACSRLQGPRVTRMFGVIEERAMELRAQGRPLDQDLWLTAWAGFDRADPPPPYSWPDGLALRDYYVADPAMFVFDAVGFSKRVPAAEAAPLRAMRERYLSDMQAAPQRYDGEGIPVSDGELAGRVFMRDALPYEDESGLWPLPGE